MPDFAMQKFLIKIYLTKDLHIILCFPEIMPIL